jgi:hypothetical protein
MFSNPRSCVRVAAAALLVLLLFVTPSPMLAATNGSEFAGFYDVQDVSRQGNTVQLTFKVRLVNVGQGDVSNATVTLRDPMILHHKMASFSRVSLSKGQHTVLSASVTIPLREFQRWQKGVVPTLMVEVKGPGNSTLMHSVALRRLPLGKGE